MTRQPRWWAGWKPLFFGLGMLALLLAGNGGGDEDTSAKRRARIESLTNAEKGELAERLKQFQKLDPADQERLRSLNKKLDDAANKAELRGIMQRYNDWLKTLKWFQRSELADLPAEERVKKIKEYLDEAAQRGSRPAMWWDLDRLQRRDGGVSGRNALPPWRLDPADVEGLFAWINLYALQHGPELLKRLPAERRDTLLHRVHELQNGKDDVRRQEILGWIWLWWQIDNRINTQPLSDKDLAELRSKLSETTRKRLLELPSKDQWNQVRGLMSRNLLQQFAASHKGRMPLPWFVKLEQLVQFFDRELSDEQREELFKKPGEELQPLLWQWLGVWLRSQWPNPPGPWGAGALPSNRQGATKEKNSSKAAGKDSRWEDDLWWQFVDPNFGFPPWMPFGPMNDAPSPSKSKSKRTDKGSTSPESKRPGSESKRPGSESKSSTSR